MKLGRSSISSSSSVLGGGGNGDSSVLSEMETILGLSGAWGTCTSGGGKLTVAKVDIDENPMTPSKFMVRGIPTLLLFKNGDLKETVVGLETKDRLAQIISKHL